MNLSLSVLLLAAVVAGSSFQSSGQENSAAQPAGAQARRLDFGSNQALTGWEITGGASTDANKSRQGKGGSLKIGPGAKALLKLRDQDQSGKVEFWVYDDGTQPENPKVSRVGSRWGLVQSDGKALAVGALYASYLGGNEGYTASAYAGASWFDQLFWLGVNRAPVGWHKWTFDFDPEAGLQVLHDDKEVNAIDSAKTSLKGFSAIAFWGDESIGKEQTIWVADLTVALGGPVKIIPASEADPYAPATVRAEAALRRPVAISTKDSVRVTPRLEALPLQESVSQYGITWTFEQPAHVGQFVNGDWYVVGTATV